MKRGFTLVELMIVAAVFAVVFLVATTVYTRSFQDQRLNQARQRNTSDNRYMLETIARAIRTGMIDYTFYRALQTNINEVPAATHHQLALRDANNNPVCFGLDDTTQKVRTAAGCTDTDSHISTAATDITPGDTQVTTFNIFIRPASDPFADRGATPVPCDRMQTNEFQDPLFSNPLCEGNQWCCPVDVASCDPSADGTNLTVLTPGICTVANVQPMVTIFLSSTVSDRGQVTTSTMQTTVTSRVYRR